MFGSVLHHARSAQFVADIEDGSVAVSIASLASGHPAVVHCTDRRTLSFDQYSAEKSPVPLMALLSECAEKLLKEYSESPAFKKHGSPKGIHVFLHTPWTHTRIASAEQDIDPSRPVTKNMIAELAKQALAVPSTIDRANLLEAGVMQVFVNGYPTANPLGTRGNHLSVVTFESDIHAQAKQLINDTLKKLLPGREVSIHAGMRAFLTVAHEHLPDNFRYVIVDVNAYTTTAAVILREAMSEEAIIPEGGMTIVKKISPSTGIPEETLSLLKMLETDMCATPACASLKETMARAEPELVKNFAEMFAQLATKRRMPNRCILSVRKELAPWLSGFLERIDFAQFTATTQPFNVQTLTPEHVQDAVTWDPSVTTDAGLAVAVACVHIFEESAR